MVRIIWNWLKEETNEGLFTGDIGFVMKIAVILGTGAILILFLENKGLLVSSTAIPALIIFLLLEGGVWWTLRYDDWTRPEFVLFWSLIVWTCLMIYKIAGLPGSGNWMHAVLIVSAASLLCYLWDWYQQKMGN